ncbi:MAG: membrane-bound lytic murein transglycosylase MltF [Gammaproteobacteria bacterium]|nr:membrane-bound lytic murein transglycosylase MltF [Gammaproteobacteria bacterium]MBT8133106.1 membrane-bound lytic murein transglycosylase MltF [Gammaproteobacteria bacterium]NNJ49067.1 membrane-bound lytic murein transglycosylase MltF [Gammaproteobacteria bacterium]
MTFTTLFKYDAAAILKLIFILFVVVYMSACEQSSDPEADTQRNHAQPVATLEKIKKRGKLIVLTSNRPTTYYYDRDNVLAGPEYEMTQSFAKFLKLEVEYKVYDSTSQLLAALRDNQGDIAASALTVNDDRAQEFDFGPVYQKISEYLVCHRKKKPIKSIDELNDLEIVIAADTSYLVSVKNYPEMTWVSDDQLDTVALLEEVAEGKIACTVSDSTLFDIERRYHIEIQNKYTLASDRQLAWALAKNNDKLKQAINDWFETYEREDLAVMLDKYYGFVEIFDYVDTHKFLARVTTRLPKYKEFFIDAARKNDIEPSLLAAQSYQESHWDRKAKSPTGVRGIMMLTLPVAKSLGVTNRLHAEQNIYAGAEFHAKMKKMVDDVSEPDRTWLALAAYNVGRGHFRDAQSLARKLDKDPDRWADMKDVLPLLSQKKYYKDLRYGYARGNEPVRYVTRIRNYDELLHKHFGKEKFDGVQ